MYLPGILRFANIFVPPRDQSQFFTPLCGIKRHSLMLSGIRRAGQAGFDQISGHAHPSSRLDLTT
jgi:hypothetical protein